MLEKFSLLNKSAIVVGGSGLIGGLCIDLIQKLGGNALNCDLKAPTYKQIIGMDHWGDFDILINCQVGNQFPVDHPLTGFLSDLNAGLDSPARACQRFGEDRTKPGVILNFGSDLSHIAPDHSLYPSGHYKPASYSAVKAGIIGLTRYYAVLWPNVRCNCICPGGINVGQKVPHNPLNRLMRIDELEGPIALLISEAGSYINGAVINVDGGRTII